MEKISYSHVTKENKKQLMKQQTKCSTRLHLIPFQLPLCIRKWTQWKRRKPKWMANGPGPAAALFTGRGSSGNSPENESSCQIQWLFTPSKEVAVMVPGSLFSLWHSCPYSLVLQRCLECEPQPEDGSFRSVHFSLLASKSQRESAQLWQS